MQTNNVVQIHSQTPLTGSAAPLQAGQTVFVRVIKSLGGGQYLASFSGGRFFVQSKIPLAAGTSFKASVSLQGGRVFLTPTEGRSGPGGQMAVKAFSALSPQVGEFLASMGLPADLASSKILQFLTQSGSRLDAALMQKARRLSKNFKGREAEAAEAAVLLEQKGLDADVVLQPLMDVFEGGGEGQKKDGQKNAGEKNAQSDFPLKESEQTIKETLKNYWKGLLQGGGGEGLFSLVNHLPSFSGGGQKKQWLFFPFEAAEISGVIRLFVDFEKKLSEKIVINFKKDGKNVFFVLYYNGRKEVSRITLSAQNPDFFSGPGSSLVDGLEKSFGSTVTVDVLPFQEFSSFGTEDLPIFGVDGMA